MAPRKRGVANVATTRMRTTPFSSRFVRDKAGQSASRTRAPARHAYPKQHRIDDGAEVARFTEGSDSVVKDPAVRGRIEGTDREELHWRVGDQGHQDEPEEDPDEVDGAQQGEALRCLTIALRHQYLPRAEARRPGGMTEPYRV